MVPGGGLEPPLPKGKRILSPLRLPFRHPGILIFNEQLKYTLLAKIQHLKLIKKQQI